MGLSISCSLIEPCCVRIHSIITRWKYIRFYFDHFCKNLKIKWVPFSTPYMNFHTIIYELTCISSSKCSEWPINCQFPSQIPHNKLTGVQCSSAALFPAAIHCINILNETLNPPSHASSIRVGICFCAKSDPNSDLYLRRIDPVYFW